MKALLARVGIVLAALAAAIALVRLSLDIGFAFTYSGAEALANWFFYVWLALLILWGIGAVIVIRRRLAPRPLAIVLLVLTVCAVLGTLWLGHEVAELFLNPPQWFNPNQNFIN